MIRTNNLLEQVEKESPAVQAALAAQVKEKALHNKKAHKSLHQAAAL